MSRGRERNAAESLHRRPKRNAAKLEPGGSSVGSPHPSHDPSRTATFTSSTPDSLGNAAGMLCPLLFPDVPVTTSLSRSVSLGVDYVNLPALECDGYRGQTDVLPPFRHELHAC